MARVIAPFKIVGTLDDLNYYIDQGDVNRVRTKGKTGITKKQFKENPIFQTIKNQSAEFKLAVHKAQSFRMVALPFYRRAKDGSFAGRANKLMLDIRTEDNVNPHGERTVEEGLKSIEAREFSIGFEGNRLRPLHKVLKTKYVYEEKTNAFTIENFNPSTNLIWPEEAEFVNIAIARANWNYENNSFTTVYSEELIIDKDEAPNKLQLQGEIPEGNHLELTFLYIGFSRLERRKYIDLKRVNNTVSIIWSK